jgi:multidrug efflux pump subunit AcrA (membrane-fusion protein)
MQWKYFKQFLIVVVLIVLFLFVQWVVKLFQQPGQMDLLESQTMDMTVHPPEGAMPVETETLREQPFESEVTYTGSAIAFNDVSIFPRVQGWLVSINVYPGDHVKQGQLLAQLDSRELSSRVNEASSAKEAASQGYNAALSSRIQAQTQAQKSEQAIQTARANLEYWQNEINRARTLAKEEVITTEELQREQSQFEAAQSQYNQALTELNAARQGIHTAGYQAASQSAQARQAGANLRTQEIIRNYTRITAPIDGVITERTQSKGTLASPGMQILRLAQLHPIRIQANVAQKDWKRLHIGDPVRIWQAKDQSGPPVEATVSAIFPMANLQTRTAIVEAVIPNQDDQFIPGDYVQMTIVTGHRDNALSVPNTAIVSMYQQQAVWVVENGKASLRYVTTGATNGTRTEILSGLKAGDVVITRGGKDLQPGVAVTSAQYGPEGIRELPKVTQSNRFNSGNNYKITYPVEDLKVTIEFLKKPPMVGDNPVSFTFKATPMGTMEMPVPSDLDIDVKTVMPAMPAMPSPKPNLRKVSDDQFKGTVNFGMSGLWQMEMTMKRKGKTIATQKFEVEVSQ